MKHTPPRKLTREEDGVISLLLTAEFPGVEALRAQLPYMSVSLDCLDCPTVELEVDRFKVPTAKVRARIPIEAEGLDVDGVPRHVLLHVDDDGFMVELQVYRDVPNDLKSPLDPALLTVLNF